MTKLYFQPITVECDGDAPRSFVWNRRSHRVSTVLSRWVIRVDWWRQEVVRRYYKVECADHGIYEIFQERGGWFLERLYD